MLTARFHLCPSSTISTQHYAIFLKTAHLTVSGFAFVLIAACRWHWWWCRQPSLQRWGKIKTKTLVTDETASCHCCSMLWMLFSHRLWGKEIIKWGHWNSERTKKIQYVPTKRIRSMETTHLIYEGKPDYSVHKWLAIWWWGTFCPYPPAYNKKEIHTIRSILYICHNYWMDWMPWSLVQIWWWCPKNDSFWR